MNFRTQYNRNQEIVTYSDQPGLTVPDMAMSIKEMLTRSMQGQPILVSNNLTYTGEDQFLPDPREMDIYEYHQALYEAQSDIKHYREELERHRADQAKEQSKGIDPNKDVQDAILVDDVDNPAK